MHYLLGSLFLLAIWLLIFIFQKKLRKEMLIASIIVTPAALTEVFFVPGYWLPDTIGNPKLSVEDFIFSFAVGGIVAVIYELFMQGKIKHERLCNCLQGKFVPALILGVGIIVVFLTYTQLKINFMYAVYLGILIDIVLIIITRADLTKKVIYSGLLFGILYSFFFFIFSLLIPGFIRYWNLKNLSGIILLGVPLEEVIWAIGTGALLGPIYEYLLSIKLTEGR